MSPESRLSARAFREVVNVLADRLAATGLARFARFTALAIAIGYSATIVADRFGEAGSRATGGLQTSAARASLWWVALVIALAASHRRTLLDRKDGLELMLLARGWSGRALLAARALAAARVALPRMVLPVLIVGLTAVAVSGTLRAARDRTLLMIACVGFAALASLAVPPLAALCEHLAHKRGRSLLIALLLGSATLAELTGDPALSLFGWLGASLRWAQHLFGVTRGV